MYTIARYEAAFVATNLRELIADEKPAGYTLDKGWAILAAVGFYLANPEGFQSSRLGKPGSVSRWWLSTWPHFPQDVDVVIALLQSAEKKLGLPTVLSVGRIEQGDIFVLVDRTNRKEYRASLELAVRPKVMDDSWKVLGDGDYRGTGA